MDAQTLTGVITLPGWMAGIMSVGFGAMLTWCAAELRASRMRREGDIKAMAAIVSDLKLMRVQMLSKDEHDDICDRWQDAINARLEKIDTKIDEKHEDNRRYRHAVRDSLQVIELVLARIAPDVWISVSRERPRSSI